jgi:hypothetical protein
VNASWNSGGRNGDKFTRIYNNIARLSRDRFGNNSLLRERGLRFYAGVPLRSTNLPIGSLCEIDGSLPA